LLVGACQVRFFQDLFDDGFLQRVG